jgi:serine/threonine-protein kinase RsbW
MKELVLPAKTSELDKVLGFVDGILAEAGAEEETRALIAIVAEEIFVNIASYAYGTKSGDVSIKCDIDPDLSEITITMADSGIPYNPLLRKDPDIGMSAEDRPIGGLGIYMVKEMMDLAAYEYRDSMNILTVKKRFGGKSDAVQG